MMVKWHSNGNDIVNEQEEVICTFGAYSNSWTAEELEEIQSNTNLIAAAPDLLEAAELALDFFKNCRKDICGREENIEYMEKAINKAKGADK